jgi:hypothetical protein
MGCFTSLCSKGGQTASEYNQYFGGRTLQDQNTLLGFESTPGAGDLEFPVSTEPILKDIDFAAVSDDNSEPSGSSGENAAIEKMLADGRADTG